MATEPAVTRRKFDREIARFREHEEHYRKLGIWMLECAYPQVLLAFATASSPQIYIPFGAFIDFKDYDERPLKVTLVNPCTRQPLRLNEVLPQFMKLPMGQLPPGRLMRVRQDPSHPSGLAKDDILQGWEDPDALPFLCIAGVRAYHEHPAHTGDSWWLYRKTDRGTLHQIIHTLWAYGTKNIVQPAFHSQISQVGFVVKPEVEGPLAP